MRMKQLIVHGDAGFRRDDVIEVDGEELICFGVNRQGDWHGPDEPQLWCTVGTEEDRETYDKRQYVPHWLDTESVDAEEIEIVSEKNPLNV